VYDMRGVYLGLRAKSKYTYLEHIIDSFSYTLGTPRCTVCCVFSSNNGRLGALQQGE
jgi:hypothetical protein